jgi:hypothetical protein
MPTYASGRRTTTGRCESDAVTRGHVLLTPLREHARRAFSVESFAQVTFTDRCILSLIFSVC